MDPYKVLEVEPSATQEDIKMAYKRASMKCHPDKGGDEEQFKLVQDAYNILSNESKRNYYDASRKVYAKGEIILDSTKDIETKIKLAMGNVIIERVK